MKVFLEKIFGWHVGYWENEAYVDSHFYTAWHLLAVLIIVGLIVAACIFYKGKSEKQCKNFLKIIAVVMIVLELARILWRAVSHYFYMNEKSSSPFSFSEIVSFALCTQMVVFTAITLLIDRPRWNKYAYNVIFAINIVAGAGALFIPTSILNIYYPLYHFSSVQTLLSHGMMLLVPVFLIAQGLYRPRFKDFWQGIVAAFIMAHIALLANTLWDSAFIFDLIDVVPVFSGLSYPLALFPLMTMFAGMSLAMFSTAYLMQRIINKHSVKSIDAA